MIRRRTLAIGSAAAAGGFAYSAWGYDDAPGDEAIRSLVPSSIVLRRKAHVPIAGGVGAVFSPDGQRLAVLVRNGEEVVVFNTSPWTEMSRFKRPGSFWPRSVAFLAGSRIVTYADRNDVHSPWLIGTYDCHTGQLVHRASRPTGEQYGRMREVVVTGDGKYVVALTDQIKSSSAPVFDAANLDNVGWLPLPLEAHCTTLAPGPGSKVALRVSVWGSRNLRRNIYVYDAGTRAMDQVIPAHIPDIKSIAWSPDGMLIASGADGLVGDSSKGWTRDVDPLRIWNATSGKLVRSFEGFLEGIEQITWHPSGRNFATIGRKEEKQYGYALRIWSPAKSDMLFEYRGPGTNGLAASFHPKTGQLLLGWKGQLFLYDVEGL